MAMFTMESRTSTILDLFTFDLTTFFLEEDYEEVICMEEAGVFMIEYEKRLPWIELDLFDNVVFRVFSEKRNITGSSHINVDFPVEQKIIDEKRLQVLVNKLTEICGKDDENKGDWNNLDNTKLNSGLIERFWTRGEGKNVYTIKLTYIKSVGLTFKILFFNHLLNLTQNN